MASTYKVLGQSIPSATTATTLYTVPAVTSAVGSTLTICNQSATATSYRIAVRPAGASLATSHYVAFGAPIGGNDFHTLTLGITLATTDVVTIYATLATLSFSLFGCEIT